MLPVPPVRYGGIERIVDALVRHLRAAGHQVALLAHPASNVPTDVRFAWPTRAGTLRHVFALRRAVRTFQPDVVHSFSRLAYLLPVLPTRQPVVMSYQRHTGGRSVRWAARLGGCTLRFTGCSEFICRQGRAAGGQWHAIPNFVEASRFDFAPEVAPEAPLVFLSRLDNIKGPDTAIAIARAAGRRLILAGNRAESGPQREFFDREIQPWLGHDGIEWIGEVDDTRKNALLRTAAALLVPIRWDEPFGIVFAEALACGTPVLTCARGAAPEIVRPGLNGFLFDSIASGVAGIAKLSGISRAFCRRDAEQRFDVAAALRQYSDLYADLIP